MCDVYLLMQGGAHGGEGPLLRVLRVGMGMVVDAALCVVWLDWIGLIT